MLWPTLPAGDGVLPAQGASCLENWWEARKITGPYTQGSFVEEAMTSDTPQHTLRITWTRSGNP